MGVKASTIWYVDAPDSMSLLRHVTSSDQGAARALVESLFPEYTAVPSSETSIVDATHASPDEVFVGCYPGVTVVCGPNLSLAKPSSLPDVWTRPLASDRTYLVSTDPETAWGAFAYWERGALRRSFSATPIYIYEDTGLPLVWERPFWAGEHPLMYPPGVMPDPQSLPFHPQEFAEAANAEWLGFRYTEAPRGEELDPHSLPVSGFTLYAPGQLPPNQQPPSVTDSTPPKQPRPRSITRWWRRKSPEPRS
ncbi:hypothetical protein [Rhodococcus sp. I2R]|uniref:DUF6928 family protein n=1 Tax=Rhodococcus sp. I2R TaxID=2855445 RepID=UPI001E41DE62|nr:hypothetical protein [Rhodococcus sp. I2R]MCC8929282.1 hypothetical protein [Rhodococcus sp. I2R]